MRSDDSCRSSVIESNKKRERWRERGREGEREGEKKKSSNFNTFVLKRQEVFFVVEGEGQRTEFCDSA